MTSGRLLLLALLAAAIGALAAQRLWTMPAIYAGAGGLDMFDMLIDGYSRDYAALYLGTLSEPARAIYLGPQRVLDTLLPMALTGTLSVSLYLLARHWGLVLALALGLVPLFYFAFDMLENAQVAVMLARAIADPDLAERASRFTVAKAQALRFAVMVVLVVLAARGLEMSLARRRKT